jgi:phospholipid transport system substrate-binding protein
VPKIKNKINMRKTTLILLTLLIGLPCLAHAEQPLKILEKNVDETIRILQNPLYRNISNKDMQQQKLWDVARQVFDFSEISMQTLGPRRQDFSAQQKKEFTEVFSKFLAKYYLRRLQEKYRDEKVIFFGQEFSTDSRASVKAKVLWNNLEIPVEIRMIKRGGTWKAYDVIVIGVSAVMNYRAQFMALLLEKTPAQIIELVKYRTRQEAEQEKKNDR